MSDHNEPGRYADMVEPPTVPVHRPGQEPPLLWGTSETVRHHDGYGDKPADELFRHVDYYQIITCPFCEWSKTGPRGWAFGNEIWMDYDNHISARHRGTKWATVALKGAAEYGYEVRDAGRHFRRHVDLDKVELLSFEVQEEDSSLRPAYTATFECGRWRGDIPNSRLSDSLNRVIEFGAFEEVTVEWHHKAPSDPAHPDEAAEAASYNSESRPVADGGRNRGRDEDQE